MVNASRNKRAKIAMYRSPDYQTSFEWIGLSVQEKRFNAYFQDDTRGGHLGYPIRKILATFGLQDTSILQMKFWVNWVFLFRRNKQTKKKSIWLLWQPIGISDQNDFSQFWFTSLPDTSNQVSSQLVFRFRRKSDKIDFQAGCHGGQLGLPIWMILVIFDLQIAPILPIKFQVNLLLVQENTFSRWRIWWLSWISERNDFIYCLSTSFPDFLPIGLSVQK